MTENLLTFFVMWIGLILCIILVTNELYTYIVTPQDEYNIYINNINSNIQDKLLNNSISIADKQLLIQFNCKYYNIRHRITYVQDYNNYFINMYIVNTP